MEISSPQQIFWFNMTDRRRQQNYTCLPHYLTDSLWNRLANEPREQTALLLLAHAWDLGLRCPSETTMGMIHNLLEQGGPQRGPVMSSYERYKAINNLKTSWRNYKQAKKSSGQDMLYSEYVDTLPRSPSDLPAEYALQAFASEEPVVCRVSALVWLPCCAFCFRQEDVHCSMTIVCI